MTVTSQDAQNPAYRPTPFLRKVPRRPLRGAAVFLWEPSVGAATAAMGTCGWDGRALPVGASLLAMGTWLAASSLRWLTPPGGSVSRGYTASLAFRHQGGSCLRFVGSSHSSRWMNGGSFLAFSGLW